MKQRDPDATVSEVLATLQNTGTIVNDLRSSGTVTGMRRINVDNALLLQIAAPTITYPAGGETLDAATTVDVTWNPNGATASAYYDLSYSDNCSSGSSWTPIGTSSPGSSSLSWTVPTNTGSDYCLSIQAMAPGYMSSAQVITNPFTVSDADSDGDGLNNIYEVTVLGTSPENVDSDGDGLVDGTDGYVLITDLPGSIDSDGDGYADGEQDTGTDPLTTNIIGDIAPRDDPNYQLDAGDLAVLTRLVTGAITPTALESALGDINGDTNINAADLLLLQQLLIAP
jgi:hypothetical protein